MLQFGQIAALGTVSTAAHDHSAARHALARADLFSGCGHRELERVAGLTYCCPIRAGTVVCREGEPGDEFYVMVSGQAVVTVDDERLATVGPEGFFGERALLGTRPRSATVTAATDLEVLVFGRDDFDRLLEVSPRVARRMLAAVSSAPAPLAVEPRVPAPLIADTVRFEWTFVALAGVYLLGAYLDAYHHLHAARIESFFSWWHGLLYAGLAVLVGFLYWSWRTGRWAALSAHPRSLPDGYGLSLVGGLLMLAVGGADTVWHYLFGFERDLEGAVSPPHLAAILATVLILTGPWRAGVQLRKRGIRRAGLARLIPTVSGALLLGSVAFATMPLNPLVSVTIGGDRLHYFGLLEQFADGYVLGGILVMDLMVVVVLLAFDRYLGLEPVDALIILGVFGLLLVIASPRPETAIVPVAGAVVAFAVLMVSRSRWLTPRLRWVRRYLLAGVTIYVMDLSYFLLVMALHGIAWRIHLWMGTCLMAACLSLGLAYLMG